MQAAITTTIIYLCIVMLGVAFKRKGILPANAQDTVSALVLNLTLPALLLSSSNGILMSKELAVYMLLGLLLNVFMLLYTILATRKVDPLLRGTTALTCSGVDIGNGVLPYILTFFPGEGVIALCTFNIGNTIMIAGVDYVVASRMAASGKPFGIKDLLSRLFGSVIFDTYLLILFLAFTHLTLPAPVMQFVSVLGNANIFLVMILIGLKLEFKLAADEKRNLRRAIAIRYSGSVVAALALLAMPLNAIVKIVFICAVFGPPSAVSIMFGKKLGYEGALTSQMYLIGIFAGMAIITAIVGLAG